MSDNAFLPCVLRVGSGLLQGCEFRLCNSRTLFIVGTTDLLGDDGLASAVPDEAIFVPLEQRGCNFEVLLGPQGVSLRILGEEIEERRVGKECRSRWFNAQTPAEPTKSTRNRRPMLKRMVVTVLLFILLAVCAAVSSLPMENSRADIAALVAGTRAATNVLQGRDGRIYVFVTSQYDAGWSRQVLMRQRISSSVLDVLRRIDLSQPSSVRVLHGTAQGPLDAELRQQVSRLLLGEAAYLRQVDFEELDERLPNTLAAQGLEQLGLTFERIEQGDGTLFTIAGDLRDAEREEARRFVDEFYRRWGRRHVRFNIELRDDPFKGRSFQLGPEGYIKTSQSSWHFPTTQQVR